MRMALLAASMLLISCGEQQTQASAAGGQGNSSSTSTPITPQSPIEAALLNQLSCVKPPRAGIAMTGLLRKHAIAETQDGGDGMVLFIPTQPMSLLGMPVVRMGGWQAGEDGGAAPPFSRGPGTSPPNSISVTVRGDINDVRARLLAAGLKEMAWVPDLSANAWTDSSGEIHQPQRKVPGVSIVEGDDDLARSPVQGAVTITCSAEEHDFDQDTEAQFNG